MSQLPSSSSDAADQRPVKEPTGLLRGAAWVTPARAPLLMREEHRVHHRSGRLPSRECSRLSRSETWPSNSRFGREAGTQPADTPTNAELSSPGQRTRGEGRRRPAVRVRSKGLPPARASEHPALDQGGPPTSAWCATAGCRRSAPPLPPRRQPGPDRRVLDVRDLEAVAVGGQRLDRAEVAEGAGRPRAVRADRPVCEEPVA